jgi:O-antigen/teichoic acid export membrane protein
MGHRSFAYNSLLNFTSQIIVFFVALLCVPYIINALGGERFGLLSILWLFVGYFNFLDLGIGQATVKFLAEHIAQGDRGVAARTARASLKGASLLSFLGAIIIVGISFVGIEHFINVSPRLHVEATLGLRWFAMCLPAVFIQGVLRSIPMAFNRFDLVNSLQVSSGLLQWAGTAAVLFFNGTFLSVIVLTVVTRYLVTGLSLLVAFRLLPELYHNHPRSERVRLGHLLRFGSWMSVSLALGPLITFLERLFIGNILTLSWVTYFVVPNDAVMKLVVFPLSITTALFPYMSGGWSANEHKEPIKLNYHRSIKYVFIIMLPITVIGVLFGHEILSLWLGSEFGEKSAFVLGLFSIGILLHALSQLPNTAVGSLGRPDLTAKLLLCELLPYLILCFFLTSNFGINGTATAWLLRIATETTFLFIVARKLMLKVFITYDFSYVWKGIGLAGAGGLGVFILKLNQHGTTAQMTSIALFFLLYSLGIWYIVIDQREKTQLKSLVLFSKRS